MLRASCICSEVEFMGLDFDFVLIYSCLCIVFSLEMKLFVLYFLFFLIQVLLERFLDDNYVRLYLHGFLVWRQFRPCDCGLVNPLLPMQVVINYCMQFHFDELFGFFECLRYLFQDFLRMRIFTVAPFHFIAKCLNFTIFH